MFSAGTRCVITWPIGLHMGEIVTVINETERISDCPEPGAIAWMLNMGLCLEDIAQKNTDGFVWPVKWMTAEDPDAAKVKEKEKEDVLS